MDNMENLIARTKEEKYLCKKIQPVLERNDFDLIRIRISTKPSFKIQVMIDHNYRSLNIDDCANISHKISDELNNISFLDEEYNLEVSSPGLDRPLTRLKDFSAWKGHKAVIKQKENGDKTSKLEGVLNGIVDSEIQVIQNDKVFLIKACNIEEAKLVS